MRALGLCFAALFGLSACEEASDPPVFTSDGDLIFLSGEIDDTALDGFLDILDANPEAHTLVLSFVGGSVDDEANMELARKVHALGLNTHVPSGGLVASGGTDLFLAGATRTLAQGACVGVHAWATEDYTANDLPRDDPEHDLYVRHFKAIDIDPAFYWYTLSAAPATDMHWMSAPETARFDMTTNGPPPLGDAETCEQR